MAAAAREHQICPPAHRSAGIGRCQQQPHHRSDGQIIQVVADKQSLRDADPDLLLEGLQGSGFVLDADQTVIDTQLAGPYLRGAATATAEKGDLHSRLLQQADAQTVSHVEALDQLTFGVEPEPAIG